MAIKDPCWTCFICIWCVICFLWKETPHTECICVGALSGGPAGSWWAWSLIPSRAMQRGPEAAISCWDGQGLWLAEGHSSRAQTVTLITEETVFSVHYFSKNCVLLSHTLYFNKSWIVWAFLGISFLQSSLCHIANIRTDLFLQACRRIIF